MEAGRRGTGTSRIEWRRRMRRRIPYEWDVAIEWRRVTAVPAGILSGQREIGLDPSSRESSCASCAGGKVDELSIVPVMTVRARVRSRAARSSRGVRGRLPAVGVHRHLRPSGYPNEGIEKKEKTICDAQTCLSVLFPLVSLS